MSCVLARWNFLSVAAAVDEILPCCGCRAWADGMVARRPVLDDMALLAASDQIWRGLGESDWLEAFRSHPRIGESGVGESKAIASALPQSVAWSEQEQRKVAEAGDSARVALAEGNQAYEKKFDRIFIVCANGKPPSEILEILQRRLDNDDEAELLEAAEQQRQITQMRLRKWLRG
jgi:2-oxo-4-hydroxy-4-carboxy-5-ureidoimidazoline decarboxylase